LIPLLAGTAVLAGCGGATGPCELRIGTYRASYTLRSGNCGEIPDVVVESDGVTVPPGCEVTESTNSEDMCSGTISAVCPGDPGVDIYMDLSGSWDQPGDHGSGTVEYLVAVNGYVYCEGTYSWVMERL